MQDKIYGNNIMAIPQPSQSDIQSLLLLLKTGKYAELEEKARHFTKKFPKTIGFYDLLSKAQIGQKDLPGTIRTLKKAIKIKPEYVDGSYNLAVAYMSLGKVKEAIPHLEHVVTLKDDHFHAYNNLGACYIQQEDLDRGLENYRKSISIKPDFIPSLMSLGSKIRAHGMAEESEKHLQKVTELEPQFAVGHYSLGLTKLVLEKKDEAKICFEQALSLQPDLKEAKEALEKL